MNTALSAEIEEAIVSFGRSRFSPAVRTSFDSNTKLLGSGALDSIGVLDLMMFLEERFRISLDDEDFETGNLETIGHLVRFVERKLPA